MDRANKTKEGPPTSPVHYRAFYFGLTLLSRRPHYLAQGTYLGASDPLILEDMLKLINAIDSPFIYFLKYALYFNFLRAE